MSSASETSATLQCQFWVKVERTRSEQMSSGLPLRADIAHCSRHVSNVPITEVADLLVWTAASLFNPPSWMNFDMADQSGFAAEAGLEVAPGSRWTYTNDNIMLLSGIIRDSVGGNAASVYRFAHSELFDKLGLEHATLEFDSVGTPVGSGHMWASTRDWARFGMLYLNDGMAGGERILPRAGWSTPRGSRRVVTISDMAPASGPIEEQAPAPCYVGPGQSMLSPRAV
jgi:CubicO group peptidase (beta-lactamase class C family)